MEKLNTAETSDSEDPIDEDNFYVVSLAGAIGLRLKCRIKLLLFQSIPNRPYLLWGLFCSDNPSSWGCFSA